METRADFLARRVREELDLAREAKDRGRKAVHLDRAASYATDRERAIAADGPVGG